MRVLIVHNSYQQYGGEDAVVENESRLLDSEGDLLGIHTVSNDRISTKVDSILTGIETVFSVRQFFRMVRVLRSKKPDLVHIHNFFPIFSPSIFYACKLLRIPVVFTLHNYRILCPTAILMFDNKIVETSIKDGPWWALKNKVYRNSFSATFILCLMIDVHRRIGTWNNVDRFIVLTEFAKSRFIAAGIPSRKLVVKPNFIDQTTPPRQDRSHFLFVGRLSPEKGIDTLLNSAMMMSLNDSHAHTIRIVGKGPLQGNVERSTNVTYLGSFDAKSVSSEMQKSLALLLPSIWYEGFPMVLVESYANGLPVIASRIGALIELIEDGVTGLLFEPGNSEDFANKIRWASDHPKEMLEMGAAARKRYEERYTPERNYMQLTQIYRDAIGDIHGTR